MDVLTVGDVTFTYCGIRLVQLGVSDRCHIDVKVLVVNRKLLRYDLLPGVDIIKRLGGACVTGSGTVSFSQLD